MLSVRQELFEGPMAQDVATHMPPSNGMTFWWLGQAGFLFKRGEVVGLIDPYLSDYLGQKYRGTKMPHDRLMPSPMPPEALPSAHFVLCSHDHGDHMDPGTLPEIAKTHPDCKFIVPAACLNKAREMGVCDGLLGIDAGQSMSLAHDLRVTAVASAHEQLTRDENGCLLHLGFIIEIDGLTVYHSGDCSPYDGLTETLNGHHIDLALLPVNGRDDERTRAGIIGNFNVEEAVDLCQSAHIPFLIPHHFGLFALNTLPPAEIEDQLRRCNGSLAWLLPRADARFVIEV